MNLPFVKMHALGNDFVVIKGAAAPDFDADFIRAISDRNTGVGFDQLMWLEPAHTPGNDIFYRIFNADGGEVEQCGNGARCVARLLAGDEPEAGRVLNMEFSGGAIEATIQADGSVSLNMGVPSFDPADLPFITDQPGPVYTAQADGETLEFRAVSVGNPHAVITVDDVATAPVERIGPLMERHECFPNRANIGFMQLLGPTHMNLRVFERGVGETSACGTGACAAAAAAREAGLTEAEVTVSLPGGDVTVSWEGPGEPLYLAGEAIKVFDGLLTSNFDG